MKELLKNLENEAKVFQAKLKDLNSILVLASLLLKEEKETLRHCFKDMLANPDYVFYLLKIQEEIVAFAYASLKYDHIKGTQTSPVCYLEGIYVKGNYRRRGLARKLLQACEKWALEHKILEFVSDCKSDNAQSLNFHLSMNFKKIDDITCFIKLLKEIQ